jgi:membrane fusion protein (multidrug efflux system)
MTRIAKLLTGGAVVVLIGVTATVYLTRGDSPRTTTAQGKGGSDDRPLRPTGVPVETTSARAAAASTDVRAVGSLQSDESVQVAPEVAGRISQIVFKEGEKVEERAVLFKLDDSLVHAEVAEQEARYALAKANLDRANELSKTGNVTDRARDEAKAAFDSANATLELARARLSKHTVLAPFAGVVGLRKISVGAFVNVGTTIVNIEKVDVLKVDFNVPELFLDKVAAGQSVQVDVDALPNRPFEGTIYAIDPMVDVNGRALRVRARLPNPDNILRPGLFARITVKGPQKQTVVVIPESAVVPRGAESFVYRIEGGKAVMTKVRLGERKAGFVEVLEGIMAEAIVVVAGHQRLRHGVAVDVVSSDPRVPG